MSFRAATTAGPKGLASQADKRSFHASSSLLAKPRRQRKMADPLALNKMPKFNYDDVPTLGHQILQRQREMLKYFRTIEWEIPKLQEMRQEYRPPLDSAFLRFRFQHYQGEAHPASSKVVLSVPVEKLFKSNKLTDKAAQHKFLLLAGERYHPTEGEVTISCERMPNERQNTKWCSDTLDKMIVQANTPSPELADVPLDPRPHMVREAKKRSYARDDAPCIKDFPKQWL